MSRVVAVYMLLLAAVVAGHFLANQFYDPAVEGARHGPCGGSSIR